MKKIIYQFADGTQNEVEVSDEFYAQYQEIEKEEKNKNRAETRRHISLSQMQENGFEPILQESSLEEDLLKEEMKKELLEAISTLTLEQQDLVYLTRRQVASDLSIGLSTLGKWIASISDETKIPTQDTDLLRENERLRKENRILREEREILKKAAIFFAVQKL